MHKSRVSPSQPAVAPVLPRRKPAGDGEEEFHKSTKRPLDDRNEEQLLVEYLMNGVIDRLTF